MTTPTMQDTVAPDFHEKRREGIGGSDAAAILGLDPWKTPLDIYNRKLDLVAPQPDTPDTLRGRHLESVAVELYATLTGRKLRKQPQRAHPDHSWMIGNVDRQILAGEGVAGPAEGTGVLEVKCPRLFTFAKIKREGLPVQYVVQLQHYLAVYGYGWGSYAVFNADAWEMIYFDITRDEKVIDALIRGERHFWHENVLKRVLPALPKVTVKVELPEVEGQLIVRSDDEWVKAAETMQQAAALRGTADDLEESAKTKLKELMGGYGAVEGGGIRVYWKRLAGRKTFDQKRLLAEHPEIKLEQYQRQGDPYEQFRAYPVSVGVGD